MDEKEKFVASTAKRKETGTVRSSSAQRKLFVELWLPESPTQNDPATGAVPRDATMLYVNGNITSLSGPGQGVAAIQDGTALTITAENNVTVTGDILCH